LIVRAKLFFSFSKQSHVQFLFFSIGRMKEEEEKKAKKDIVDFEKKSKLIHGLYTSVFFSLYAEIE